MQTQEIPAMDILMRGLNTFLACSGQENPNRARLEEVAQYAAESRNRARTLQERSALLRSAADILQSTRAEKQSSIENEALGVIRIAMTAAMFEFNRSAVAQTRP